MTLELPNTSVQNPDQPANMDGYLVEKAKRLHTHLLKRYGDDEIHVWCEEDGVYATIQDGTIYTEKTYKCVICIVCGGMKLRETDRHPWLADKVHIGDDDCNTSDSNVTPHITLEPETTE